MISSCDKTAAIAASVALISLSQLVPGCSSLLFLLKESDRSAQKNIPLGAFQDGSTRIQSP